MSSAGAPQFNYYAERYMIYYHCIFKEAVLNFYVVQYVTDGDYISN